MTEYVRPEDRVFDRIPQFDPKSRRFGVDAVLEVPYARSYTWGCSANLDQGPDGACVGFGWSHEAAANPVPIGVDYSTAMALYHAAQKIDEWSGENYEGTSVLAGAKVAQQYGWLKEYRWAFNLADALAAISRKGPAVLGVNWYDGMFYPDADGFISVYGSVVGGHCILARGTGLVWLPGTTAAQKRSSDWLQFLDWDRSHVLLHNSWGPQWGGTKWGPGTAKISVRNFDRLRGEEGEVCVPVLRTA